MGNRYNCFGCAFNGFIMIHMKSEYLEINVTQIIWWIKFIDMKIFNHEIIRSILFWYHFQIDLKIEGMKIDPNMNKYRYTCAHCQQLICFYCMLLFSI